MSCPRKCALLVLLFGSALLLAPEVLAVPVTCSAEVRSTPRSDEVHDQFVDKVFAVEIDTREACAKVYIDLTTTERLFNGEEITSTKRDSRKVTADSAFKMTYRIARDTTLVKAEFKVSSCVVCGTE